MNTNRQQLIEWLIDDVTPRIKKSGNAEGELLKFAHEKNLSPALLEAMGQLFNTAKTLCYLEKSATSNRGGDFPLVDVPALVDKYLEVKSAANKNDPAWRESVNNANRGILEMPLTGGIENHFPADLFAAEASTVEQPDDWMSMGVIDNSPAPDGQLKLAATPQVKRAILRSKQAEIDKLNESIFNADQDCLGILQKWAKAFRQNSDMDFKTLESMTLKRYGDTAKPSLDKLAGHMSKVAHLTVTRSADPGPDRLLNDEHRFLPDVASLMTKLASLKEMRTTLATLEQVKSTLENDLQYPLNVEDLWTSKAAAGAVAEEEEVKHVPASMQAEKRMHQPGGRSHAQDRPARSSSDEAVKAKSTPSQEPTIDDTMPNWLGDATDAKGVSQSMLTQVPNQVLDSTPMNFVNGMIKNKLQELLSKGHNNAQAQLDSSAYNVKSKAMLQNLLLTDEVLSEADPDKVVSAYNTIRTAAPQLANDANVMRVALRAAIQHQGIDPFTLKGFSDAESARQKVEDNNRQTASRDYSIGDSGGGKKNNTKRQDKED